MKWVFRIAVVVALAALGYWLWTVFFPGPERMIRKRLNELQQIASFNSTEAPLAKLANANKLASYFTSDIQIIVDLPGQQGILSGRNELLQRAVGLRNAVQGFEVKLYDVNVSVASDKRTANVNLTATAKLPGEKDFMIQELELTMVKSGEWMVSQVKTVRTLQ